MTQTWAVGEIDPATTPPATDIVKLTEGLNSLKSQFSGASLPATNLVGGQIALDTTNNVYWRRDPANTKWMLHASAADALVVAKSGAYTAVLGDFGKTLVCTGSWTLSLTAAATLTDGWWIRVVNSGSGTITLDPNASETVNGAATLARYPDEDGFLVCDGSSFRISRHAPLTGAAFTGGINEKLSTVASATTPDIFALTVGNVIDYTGTATCTGFVAAPQAGARRTLVCAGAAPFTAGANMLIEGVTSGQNLTCAAGTQVDVVAVTTTQFRLKFTPVQGTFTSTVTSGSGTLTSATGTVTYTRDGGWCHGHADLTITTNGTGASEIVFTLPFTHKATQVSSFVGRETAVTGKRLWGYINGGGASAIVVNVADGSYVGGDGYILRVSFSYPIA